MRIFRTRPLLQSLSRPLRGMTRERTFAASLRCTACRSTTGGHRFLASSPWPKTRVSGKDSSLAATRSPTLAVPPVYFAALAANNIGIARPVAAAYGEGPRDPLVATLWRGGRDSGAGVQRLRGRVRHRLAGASRSSYPSGGAPIWCVAPACQPFRIITSPRHCKRRLGRCPSRPSLSCRASRNLTFTLRPFARVSAGCPLSSASPHGRVSRNKAISQRRIRRRRVGTTLVGLLYLSRLLFRPIYFPRSLVPFLSIHRWSPSPSVSSRQYPSAV